MVYMYRMSQMMYGYGMKYCAQVWSIASSEDGNWLASGGADSLICLWKVASKNYMLS